MLTIPKFLPPMITAALLSLPAVGDPLPPDASYRPLPTQPFETVKAADMAEKSGVMQRQQEVFDQRYDLSDHPIPGALMSGGRKPVQGSVRVKLPQGLTWDNLAQMSSDEIRD